MSPSKVGRYTVSGCIGYGAYGVVYAAHDPLLDREVAIKVLRHGDESDIVAERKARLVRESRALASLSEPSVLPVFDIGLHSGRIFFVTELIDGVTLKQWVSSGRSAEEIMARFVEAGRGLAAAHRVGLVHRDFKPENVMVGYDGRVRVLDFGVARFLEADGGISSSPGEPVRGGDMRLTRSGAAVGTPAYMSPEQHTGGRITTASDQFAFCVALWEALCGQHPFAGNSLAEVRRAVFHGSPRGTPPVAARAVRALRRGMAVQREQRFCDMDALLRVLTARSRWWPAALGTVAVVAAAVPVWNYVAQRQQVCAGAHNRIAQTWNPGAQRAVQRALTAAGVPYAVATASHVRDRIDTFAQAWVAMHTEACEATSIAGNQGGEVLDLRMGCLSHARAALDAAIAVLRQGDATTVERAPDVVSDLPPISRCGDLTALRSPVPLPATPAAQEAVNQASRRLASARALERAGSFEAALEHVEAVRRDPALVDYEPITTEVQLVRGEILERIGRLSEARTSLVEAFEVGVRFGQLNEAALAASAAVSLISIGLADPAAGLELAHRASVATKGAPREAVLELRRARAGALARAGRLEEAVSEQLALLHESLTWDNPLAVASQREALGFVYERAERFEDAEEQYRQSLQLWDVVLGPTHPGSNAVRVNLANTLLRQGRSAEAEAAYRKVLEASRETWGPAHPRTAMTLSNLAVALEERGEFDEARIHYESALEGLVATYGERHPQTSLTRANWASTIARLGRFAEAESALRECIPILASALGDSHGDVAGAHFLLGDVLASAGRWPAAEAEYQAAVTGFARTFGLEHHQTIAARVSLWRALVEQGRELSRARDVLEAAWARVEPAGEPALRGITARSLSRALWADRGERARATHLANVAIEAFGDAGPRYAADRQDAVAWRRTLERRRR